jgi:putative SOS response-associated peptidase YedK
MRRMCGRFTLTATPEQVAEQLGLAEAPAIARRYNIAPTQAVPVVRLVDQARVLDMTWGLVPHWAKDAAGGARMINARADTAPEKPAFRSAYKRRRCLIAADGFFEWRTQGKHKQPVWFRLRDGRVFAFAGLWEHWEGEGQRITSCTILTTDANELVRPVHDRMPVILDPGAQSLWLAPTELPPDLARDLLRPYDPAQMTATDVDPRVNNARIDDPDCVRPIAVQQRLL